MKDSKLRDELGVLDVDDGSNRYRKVIPGLNHDIKRLENSVEILQKELDSLLDYLKLEIKGGLYMITKKGE